MGEYIFGLHLALAAVDGRVTRDDPIDIAQTVSGNLIKETRKLYQSRVGYIDVYGQIVRVESRAGFTDLLKTVFK